MDFVSKILLNLLFSSNNFMTESRIFCIQAHITWTQIQFYYFLSDLNVFYFSYRIALASISSIMLNRSFESEHPCLFLILGGKAFNLLSLSLMFDVGLSYIDFVILKNAPSTENKLKILYSR